MSYADFCRCEPEQFEAICRAWSDGEKRASHERWEQTRLLAAICIQPHVRQRVNPRTLLPLPWDKKKAAAPAATSEPMTQEQRLARLRQLTRKG